ncbi:MAG: DUF4234 domain-containing protein [Lachnospiraceae bacterium]|nr:DUF4234 domain-containing protein [Lachnospiraceae bacterium]
MICKRCGNQNRAGSHWCSFCGAPLEEAGDSAWNQTDERSRTLGIIAKVVAAVCGILYFVRGLQRIPSLVSNIVYLIRWPRILTFTNVIAILLTIAACIICTIALLLFALGASEDCGDNRGQLYLFTAASAVLRILVAVIVIPLTVIGYALSGYHLYLRISNFLLQLSKVILCAALTEGVLFALLYLGGCRIVVKATKDGFSSVMRDVEETVRKAVERLFQKRRKENSSGAGKTQTSENAGFQTNRGMNADAESQTYADMAHTNSTSYGQGGFAPYGQGGTTPYGQDGFQGHEQMGANSGTSNQQTPGREVYYAPAGAPDSNFGYIPRERLKEDRSLVLYIVFTILTCGIYGFYFIHSTAEDLNVICKEDGRTTKGLLGYIGLSIVSCGVYSSYWGASFVDRMAFNAPRYGVTIEESGTTYILWNFPGVLLCFVGPFIALHIIIKNMNKLARAYNEKYHL